MDGSNPSSGGRLSSQTKFLKFLSGKIISKINVGNKIYVRAIIFSNWFLDSWWSNIWGRLLCWNVMIFYFLKEKKSLKFKLFGWGLWRGVYNIYTHYILFHRGIWSDETPSECNFLSYPYTTVLQNTIDVICCHIFKSFYLKLDSNRMTWCNLPILQPGYFRFLEELWLFLTSQYLICLCHLTISFISFSLLFFFGLMKCYMQILLSRHLNLTFATGAFLIPTSLYFLLKVITITDAELLLFACKVAN